MSTQSHDPFGDPSLADLTASFDAITDRVQRLEPVVRDFNRRMRDVFGSCTSSPTGEWVSLDESGDLIWHAELADIFRLPTGLDGIARLVDTAEVRREVVRRRAAERYGDTLPTVPDDAPTLHPPMPTQIWNDRRKGDK